MFNRTRRSIETIEYLSTSLICLFQIYDGDGSKIKNDKLSPFSEKQERNASVPWRLQASKIISWKTNKVKSSNQNSQYFGLVIKWVTTLLQVSNTPLPTVDIFFLLLYRQIARYFWRPLRKVKSWKYNKKKTVQSEKGKYSNKKKNISTIVLQSQ